MSHNENRRNRNNNQPGKVWTPEEQLVAQAANDIARQEAMAAQQQMHLQMLHQSAMREVYVKFVEQDMTDNGFRIAANRAARAAEAFMARLGVKVDLGASVLKEDELEGDATSGYTQQ